MGTHVAFILVVWTLLCNAAIRVCVLDSKSMLTRRLRLSLTLRGRNIQNTDPKKHVEAEDANADTLGISRWIRKRPNHQEIGKKFKIASNGRR